MQTPQLLQELTAAHQDFVALFNRFDKTTFESQLIPGKWTAGEQLLHILKSVRPVSTGLKLPIFIPKLLFGPPNREPMPYDVIVKNYQKKLAEGLTAPPRYEPSKVDFASREKLLAAVVSTVASIVKSAAARTERDLDSVTFPHPSLGKLSIREMLLFTLYHVRHHHHQVEALLAVK